MGSIKVAKEWLSYANTDLIGAKALVDMGENFLPLAAFHAQQAAEKAIKGYLVFISVRIPKTHDLADLISLVELKNPTFAKKLLPSTILTDYAVAYRYPDAQKEPLTRQVVLDAIATAQAVLDICIKLPTDHET